MSISDNKTKVLVYMNKDLDEKCKSVSSNLGISKSAFIQLAVASYLKVIQESNIFPSIDTESNN